MSIISYFRIQRAAITRKVVIAVVNGVLSALCLESKAKINSSITLSTQWTRSILKLLECVKRRETTETKKISLALYKELDFFRKKNSSTNSS